MSRLLPSSSAESGGSDRDGSEKISEVYLDVRRPPYEPPAPPAPMEPLYAPGPEGKVRGKAPHSAPSGTGGEIWPLWTRLTACPSPCRHPGGGF